MAKKLRSTEEGDGGGGRSGREVPKIIGWDIRIDDDADDTGESEREQLEACEMGLDGSVIVGVGSKGNIWIWAIRPES